MRLFLIICLVFIGFNANSQIGLPNVASKKTPKELVLALKEYRDDEVISNVELYANSINPNVMSIYDNYLLKINGKKVDVPQELLTEIAHKRRSFSYDSLSGGIKMSEPKFMCMLGGPALGYHLEVRYLNYSKNNFKIESSKMMPVFSRSKNCLFNKSYSPIKENSKIDAGSVVEMLRTIKLILGK